MTRRGALMLTLARLEAGDGAKRQKIQLLAERPCLGLGIGVADSRRTGERFYCILGNDETGSGLGWSIVRRIAAVHAADLSVSPSSTI